MGIRQSLDRLPKQLSERWEAERERFEAALRAAQITGQGLMINSRFWPQFRRSGFFERFVAARIAGSDCETWSTHRFKDQGLVEHYESKEYGSETYSTFICQLQQPALERIIVNLNKVAEHLCACWFLPAAPAGSYRALKTVVDVAEGIDISANM